MKTIVFTALAVGIMMLTACKEKKQGDGQIITTDYEVPQPKAPVAMSQTADSRVVQWVDGRVYKVSITRMPADSLPMVTDEIGQKYVDNAVRVAIMRSDSTTFIDKVFTKSAFASHLDNDYRHNAMLVGMHYLECHGTEMDFVAVFNHPAATDDEAIDLKLTIDSQRNIKIQEFDDNQREDLDLEEE